MRREGIDKNDFANRMNQMFKVAEKECVVESFRKKENKMNHNCHFSKWLKDSDSDYSIAEELYEKLKKKERYEKTLLRS